MNHYINLLETSEIQYVNKVEAKPVYKLAAGGLVLLLVAWFGLSYQKLKAIAREGDRIESTWKRIEKDVEAAKQLHEKKMRLGNARETLEGWPSSQHDWPAIFDYIVNQTPGLLSDVQFTRFSFDENMIGMRDQVPGPNAVIHPLKRQISIKLRGIIQADRPERMLTQFQRNIQSGEGQPSTVEEVSLDNYLPLRNENGDPINRTQFTFTIDLKAREVKP
jgi:hypothetical protein